LQGWLEGMEGMDGGGEKRRIWVPDAQLQLGERSAAGGQSGSPSSAIVVDVEVLRWMPDGEEGAEVVAMRQERTEQARAETEERARMAEAMRVAGRLAPT
jgi:hypothetical protein